MASTRGPNYLVSNVFRYHDTFPHPPEVPNWPELIPESTLDDIAAMVEAGALILGDPDDALAAVPAAGSRPVSTSSCSASGPAPLEETLEMIRLMGEHVIPKIDTDPEHRTNRYPRPRRPSNDFDLKASWDRSSGRISKSPYVYARYGSCDHQALDFGRAFEDRVGVLKSSGLSALSMLVRVGVRSSRRIQADSTRCRDE